MDCQMQITTEKPDASLNTSEPKKENQKSVPRLPGGCATIHDVIEQQAKYRPDQIAVVCGEEKLTYRELNARANQLARHLQDLGVGTESLVGLYLERSVYTVIGIVAILKAGAAYLPIDLAYPPERVEFMLKDSQAAAVITEAAQLESLGNFEGRIACLDEEFSICHGEMSSDLGLQIRPENAAYVIYTSGSTGVPKGVLVTHHNVLRLFTSTEQWFGFNENDVWSVFHSFAFDFSVWELWGALFYGGKAVIVPKSLARSPETFYQLLARESVTVLNQTPSAFRQLIWAEHQASECHRLSLRYVVFGGEALELQSLRPWFERHGDAQPQLINMYGITETTVHVTYRPITINDVNAGLGSVIGKPIPDLTIHLLY
jgi:amino acid adenylation domain-containing protein